VLDGTKTPQGSRKTREKGCLLVVEVCLGHGPFMNGDERYSKAGNGLFRDMAGVAEFVAG
jgi:hypothetical protein